MVECLIYGSLRYCTVNGVFMVGDNTSTPRNGLFEPNNCPNLLVIPFSVQGKKVEQIGSLSFYECHQINIIIIEAMITVIHHAAFERSFNLQRVYLPNTLEIIYGWGFQMYNGSSVSASHGSVDFIFEPNSKLRYIGDHAMSYKEHVNIFICDYMNPSFNGNPFASVVNVTFFSPKSFHIYGRNTITENYFPLCSHNNNHSFCQQYIQKNLINIIISLILYILALAGSL